MQMRIVEGTHSKLESISTAVNSAIRQMEGLPPMDVAVVGYRRNMSGEPELGSRFGADFSGRIWVSSDELIDRPLRIETRTRKTVDPVTRMISPVQVDFPIWFETSIGPGRLEHSHVFQYLAELLQDWAENAQPVIPPLVFSFIADLQPGNSIANAVVPLGNVSTAQGFPVLLQFHAGTYANVPAIKYPSQPQFLPYGPVQELFFACSPLTDHMLLALRQNQEFPSRGAKGLVHNGRMIDMVRMLSILKAIQTQLGTQKMETFSAQNFPSPTTTGYENAFPLSNQAPQSVPQSNIENALPPQMATPFQTSATPVSAGENSSAQFSTAFPPSPANDAQAFPSRSFPSFPATQSFTANPFPAAPQTVTAPATPPASSTPPSPVAATPWKLNAPTEIQEHRVASEAFPGPAQSEAMSSMGPESSNLTQPNLAQSTPTQSSSFNPTPPSDSFSSPTETSSQTPTASTKIDDAGTINDSDDAPRITPLPPRPQRAPLPPGSAKIQLPNLLTGEVNSIFDDFDRAEDEDDSLADIPSVENLPEIKAEIIPNGFKFCCEALPDNKKIDKTETDVPRLSLLILLVDRSVSDLMYRPALETWNRRLDKTRFMLGEISRRGRGRYDVALIFYGKEPNGTTSAVSDTLGAPFICDKYLVGTAGRVEPVMLHLPNGIGGLLSLPRKKLSFTDCSPTYPADPVVGFERAVEIIREWDSVQTQKILPPVLLHITSGKFQMDRFDDALVRLNTVDTPVKFQQWVFTERPHPGVCCPNDEMFTTDDALLALWERTDALPAREFLAGVRPGIHEESRGMMVNMDFDVLFEVLDTMAQKQTQKQNPS